MSKPLPHRWIVPLLLPLLASCGRVDVERERRIDVAANSNFSAGTPTEALRHFVVAEHGECKPDRYSPFGVAATQALNCTIPFEGYFCAKRYYWISAKLSPDGRFIEAMKARPQADYC